MKFNGYQRIAERLVKQAGQILLKYQERAIVKKNKSDLLDITTDADLASEKFLISEIHKLYPDHNILSEEQGEEKRGGDFTWVLDPLCGTKEYIRRLPFYASAVALEYADNVVVGSIFRPATNELFSASLGNGAYLNGRRVHVSGERSLSKSFILSHLPNYKTPRVEAKFTWMVLQELANHTYRLRTSTEDSTALCWLALGAFEGFILTLKTIKWWDVAPGFVIAKEAGAKITDIYGKEIRKRNLSNGLVASNGKIHDELLEYLKD